MRFSPGWAAGIVERQAAQRFQREQALNAAIEARNPRLRPTAKYAAGPLPPSDTRFYTRANYLDYRWRRAMGKYDPFVRY